MIEVRRTGEGDPLEFEVVVREGQGETRHHVCLPPVSRSHVSWLPGDSVVIAAHAKVLNADTDEEEGAWGDGPGFVQRGNWAMYFTYEVQEPFLCGGETSKCVFVTSTTRNGNLGGLSGADTICNALAAGADLPGSYLAWLSDGDASPSTRFNKATVPYRRVDGTAVAPDWFGLVDGMLDAPIALTEGGGNAPTANAWTGTNSNGDSAAHHCISWRDNGSGRTTTGLTGSPRLTGSLWTSGVVVECQLSLSWYCFQQ